MKRVINSSASTAITSASYASTLREMQKALNEPECGRHAIINQEHRCVDILDDNGIILEQRYPAPAPATKGTRGKFVYVGPGNGDYVLTRVSYDKKEYSSQGGLTKHISYTS